MGRNIGVCSCGKNVSEVRRNGTPGLAHQIPMCTAFGEFSTTAEGTVAYLQLHVTPVSS